MADPIQPSALLVGLVGGAVGSVFTAWIGYLVQNRLAARRRVEKEESLAYVALVKISTIVVNTRIMKEGPLTLAPVRAFREQLDTLIAANPGMTEQHAACALLSVLLTHEGNSELGLDSRQMVGHLVSMAMPQFERIAADFQIGPSQLAEMPRPAVEAYSLVAAALSTFGGSLTMMKEYADGGSETLVSPEGLYMCWASYDFLATNAERLRKELVAHARVGAKDAEDMLERQRADFTSHLPMIMAAREPLDVAKKAIKPLIDAQLAMVLAVAKMASTAMPTDTGHASGT